jgi:anti-anti-sigma regulatory factor
MRPTLERKQGPQMLKVTTTDQNQTITLKLEGKLAGPWVQEVTRVWADTARSPRGGYVIDLRSVTFIDSPGRALLTAMSRDGAELIATDCLTRNIVDEIHKEVYSQPESQNL